MASNTKLEFYIQNYFFTLLNEMKIRGDYKYEWTIDKSEYEEINFLLKGASKKTPSLQNKKNNVGKPDLIYFNPETKTLILVEFKRDKNYHSSNNVNKINNPTDYAVDGVLYYSTFFKSYDVFAIAISGEPKDYLINQFFLPKNKKEVITIPAQRILNEFDYENIISDYSVNTKIGDLSMVLSNLNEIMHANTIETGKRPIILGSIIFALIHFKQIKTDIEKLKYDSNNISKLLTESIKTKMLHVLPRNKFEDNSAIIDRFCSLIESYSISNTVWSQIIKSVDNNLMPIINNMKKASYHDFSGDMYRVLLRYTSGDGKILGQVLTPKHVANLMIDLADLKRGDSILDPACGTGIFLVNSMNKLISLAENQEEIEDIKSKKIYGIEISKEMFFLTLVNMLINDDGKTNIFVDDINPDINNRGIFKYSKSDFLEQPKKVIMNPPYLTHKEMWNFILKSMKLASEKVVVIIPTSILNNNENFKKQFLRKHSLISVINMPNNIFQNKSSSSASIKTSILIGEINKPNSQNLFGTYFYDLKDDGFISSKKLGRYDGNNNWNLIKDNLLNAFHNREEIVGVSKLVKRVTEKDSWHFNYFNKIEIEDFESINTYLFNFLTTLIDKKYTNLIEANVTKAKLLNDMDLKELNSNKLIINKLEAIPANNLLKIVKDYNKALRIEKYENAIGNISYVAAANANNGARLLNTRNIYNETILNDKFTWNAQGDGGAGLAFYHPYDFIVASTAQVYDIKEKYNLAEKIFLAFAMSLEHKNRYHGNSITDGDYKNSDLTISLPFKDKKIDWENINFFMENNPIFKKIDCFLKKQ